MGSGLIAAPSLLVFPCPNPWFEPACDLRASLLLRSFRIPHEVRLCVGEAQVTVPLVSVPDLPFFSSSHSLWRPAMGSVAAAARPAGTAQAWPLADAAAGPGRNQAHCCCPAAVRATHTTSFGLVGERGSGPEAGSASAGLACRKHGTGRPRLVEGSDSAEVIQQPGRAPSSSRDVAGGRSGQGAVTCMPPGASSAPRNRNN